MISFFLADIAGHGNPFISSATVFAPVLFTSATMTALAPSRVKRRHKALAYSVSAACHNNNLPFHIHYVPSTENLCSKSII